jgi:hypothetical protein
MRSIIRAKTTLLAILCCCVLLGACASNNRMLRMTPFWSDQLPDPDRVNIWPLYYQTGETVVVLWPVFDVDEKGFAFRPVVSKEDNEWSFLYPLGGWNTKTGEWWAIPAYDFDKNHGVAPLWNFGEWNHVLLAWWLKSGDGDVTDWGVFPFYGTGDINHVGPVWWEKREADKPLNWGVFPLAAFDEDSGWVINTYWKTKDNEFKVLTALPLFYYSKDGSYRRFLTPLGGWGSSDDGEKGFYNVLGPVFYYDTDGKSSYTAFLWPIFTVERDKDSTAVGLWPVFNYRGTEKGHTFSALLGLIEHSNSGEDSGVRVAPFFSCKDNRPMGFWDFFTLYSYQQSRPKPSKEDEAAGRTPPPDVHLHIGTPLLFHLNQGQDKTSWGSLLNIVDYESKGDESEFAFLYYLYRQQRKGKQVRRDLFPFVTWDSGPEKSSFSFLWRFFRWENVGDKSRGYFLFIPWGDHSEPKKDTPRRPTGAQPALRPQ